MHDVLLVKFQLVNRYYILDTMRNVMNVQASSSNKCARSETLNETKMWYMRLGHIGVRCLSRLVKDGQIPNLTMEPYPVCESCIQRKMTKFLFTLFGHDAFGLLELIHSDVCDPMNLQ